MPIASVAELEDSPTKPVRLLGEDLVLYRDRSGTLGLLDWHCAHPRADLSYGIVEACGLRCNSYRWLYGERGQCLAPPFEDIAHPEARCKDRIRIKAYPVEAKAGLVWAYLGPSPQPLVPAWEPFTWRNGFVQIVFSEVPCNWLQYLILNGAGGGICTRGLLITNDRQGHPPAPTTTQTLNIWRVRADHAFMDHGSA